MNLDIEPVGVPLPRPSRHRSRRLRKKMHLDEFQQKGFHVGFKVREGMERAKLDKLWDRFIEEAIEGNGLGCGGGGSLNEARFYVMGSSGRRCCSATEDQRQAVLDWLEANREHGIVDYAVSGLVDANYDIPQS